MKTAAALVGLNLVLFILVTSLPYFQILHHHWIFPLMAAFFSLEWVLARQAGGRNVVLFHFAFLILIGVARHETVLRCFDRCSLKLSLTVLMAGILFLWQSRLKEPTFWNRLRSQFAAAACLSWTGYLFLLGMKLAPWYLEIIFVILALLFWLARSNPAMRAVAIGIPIGLTLRRVGGEHAIIFLSYLTLGVGLWSLNFGTKKRESKKDRPASILTKIVRTAGLLAILLILGAHALGPITFMIDSGKRWERLTRLAPEFPPLESLRLSPLETRLKDHVVALATKIGERAAYQPKAQAETRDYLVRQFERYGYAPTILPYESTGLYSVRNGTMFFNVEAAAGSKLNPEKGILLVSAHYDTAPGTRGADDNASGVAVLLEVARLMKDKTLDREIRFVSFGTEEPPAFGTQNMGSYHYARRLREEGTKVEGLINLEMVGYYNPKKGAQLYPPFLHLIYPDHGNFIAVVSNLSSRKFLNSVKKKWTVPSGLPLVTATLPSIVSQLTLSDQINFWDQGFPAVMVTDTAFFRNPHYHEMSDTPEKLNYEKMAEVTRSLADVLAKL